MNIPRFDPEILQSHYQEAFTCHLTQMLWRKQLAQKLRALAQKLEPQTKGGRQTYTGWRLMTKTK